MSRKKMTNIEPPLPTLGLKPLTVIAAARKPIVFIDFLPKTIPSQFS